MPIINEYEVNPAYTSQIGRSKYAGKKKLTVHDAAAYVIARKGQGYIDKNHVERPILMYEEEKKVVKEALSDYKYKLESELRGR